MTDLRRSARPASAELAEHETTVVNLNQAVRDGLPLNGCTTYEEWDLMRRELFAEHDGDARIEEITVQHGEYETALCAGSEGRVVACWYTSTGECHIQSPKQACLDIAAALNNMLNNSLKHGWGEVNG